MLGLKSFMYPATIEFSITCATIFVIMWNKIGQKHKKNLSLLPPEQNFKGVGKISMPFSNSYIMLDCTKTSKGLFFGIIIFAGTLLSYILFLNYKSTPETKHLAKLISEVTELSLLLIALLLTIFAFNKIRKNYSKVVPEINMFDIVLEVVSLVGIYSYCINSLVAVIYNYFNHQEVSACSPQYYLDNFECTEAGHVKSASSENEPYLFVNEMLMVLNSLFSIIQGTLQTLFILECLRRYAFENKPFMKKPARELITALLSNSIYTIQLKEKSLKY